MPSSGRTAAATIAACSGSPCVVRSPASSTRSTCSRSPAKASVQRSWSPSRPRWMSPVAAIRIAQLSRAARPASFSERMAMLRRVPGYDAPYVRGRRAAVLRHRGDAEEVRGGAARGRRPVPAGREPRVVGARRPGDAPRPRPDDQARGRGPRAAGARRRRHARGGPARGVARQGLGRRRARRPHLLAQGPADRRRRDRARRGARRAVDDDARHGPRGRAHHQADGDLGAPPAVRGPDRDRPGAARAHRLAARPRRHRLVALRPRVLRHGRGAGDRPLRTRCSRDQVHRADRASASSQMPVRPAAAAG